MRKFRAHLNRGRLIAAILCFSPILLFGQDGPRERIGIDNLDMPALEAFQKSGLQIVNGWPAVSAARVVKTRYRSSPQYSANA